MRTLLIGVLLLSGCVHRAGVSDRTDEKPRSAWRSEDADEETVAIVGINDFHGSLLPKERKLRDGRKVKSGGALALSGILRILSEETGGRLLIVDAGDEWQGTLESNQVKGASVVEFYNRIGLTTAAIGNHEFDFGIPNLHERLKQARYPYLAANIKERKSGVRVSWPNVFPSRIFDVAGYRIGVAGFSTVQTPSTTRYEFVSHLAFQDPLSEIRAEAKSLRNAGANAVLLTAHAGTVCENRFGLKEWRLIDRNTEQGKCDPDQEISALVGGLSPGELDGVVAGHTHQVIHHFLNGTPVIQGEAYNQYLNILYLVFKKSDRSLVGSKTRIEGLVPICSEVFAGTSHCDVRRLPEGSTPNLEPATFHGYPIRPDPELEAWLKPIHESTERFRNEVLAVAELPLDHYREREGAFGNLVADVLREKGRADFALVNSGGIRTPLDSGEITYDGVFRALPFDNLLNVVELTGAQVKMLYRIASSGAHGVIGVSGLELTLLPFDVEAPKKDLNGNGKFESWEAERLISITRSGGKPIDDRKSYRVATFDFLVKGGDDLSWFFSRIPKKAIRRERSGYCRDLVTEYLRTHPRINTRSAPLVDPVRPRIRFVRE
jgi:5'-nucleotidase